ncbi:hybrid sensor histidine kinase/response regulator [Duganella sp. Leaf61]|uniref:hybrid sensor histidine kinase/response regulator n=1 Tax=Duganella sp. Leaf61 TaxID=1736227 RepID=UPI0009EA1D22|nr:response regulator [Duganella sp. Leaf61]
MNPMTGPDDQLDAGLLLQTLTALKNGDFSARMPSGGAGVAGQVADTLNQIMAAGEKMNADSRAGALLTQSQSLAQELRQTNQELAEKARLLSEQNIEVEQAKLALEEKATQLALSSRYKSEFLANMSHELRTPLNSLLILAQQLGDNPDGNLSDKQVEFARTIHGSGSDLLTLINDILDLSKIESGTVTLEFSEYRFEHLHQYVERTFRHMAEARHLDFSIELQGDLPAALMTDTTRLQQVLKNLLSNAFKFTSHGRVALTIGLADGGYSSDLPTLCRADAVLAFAVNDTGVGIVADKLQLIFEAFQQADGSTARKYGGTGLGLSISRELARLLGGEIRVESVLGGGSTFTLFLPWYRAGGVASEPALEPTPAPKAMAMQVVELPELLHEEAEDEIDYHDDRALLAPGDPSVLIIADDERLAAMLLDLARAHRFKGVVTANGDSALSLARDYLPWAILLDLDLPDIDGLTVLERLKRDPGTRHIPVHALSNRREQERDRQQALRLGAQSYLYLYLDLYQYQPADREALRDLFARIRAFLARSQRSLLVVTGDATGRDATVGLLGAADLDIVAVDTGVAALAALRARRFDCMVLDMALPDMSGFELLGAIAADRALRDVPVVVNTAGDVDRKQLERLARLERGANGIVIREADTPERLLDETALFLHRSPANLSESQRRMLEEIHEAEGSLTGRSVLIVDDDVRNIFALSSLLERQQMQVSFAENGRDGIKVLERDPSIEIVLMDIMMPEMDGYDTMRAIRRIARFRSLPIITLTAKAMKGDRDKCIAAGASDYISKPVDVGQLLSLLRVWLN